MSDRSLDSEYVNEWGNEATQCKNCSSFYNQEDVCVCVTSNDKTFEELLEENGEISPEGHCDYFKSLD
jgi:hypothetical protein